MPIYTDKVTYGQSNTPSENHFIDGSTPNVLSIKRGTPLAPGAEVLNVSAGVVSFPQGAYGGLTLGTAQATTSGTAKDFGSIPSWVNHITVMFDLVSLSGSDDLLVQLGVSGVFETTGYSSGSANASNSSTGFVIRVGNSARAASGTLDLYRQSGNVWVSTHDVHVDSLVEFSGAGRKSMGGNLSDIRITRTGTDTFDAGSVNIMYEG